MTEKITELHQNYEKLIILSDQLRQENNIDLFKKIQIIDRMITDVNIAIEDLNFELLGEKKKKYLLNEEEQQIYDDMVVANTTIKAFSPYIMWFNIYQKLSKDNNKAEQNETNHKN